MGPQLPCSPRVARPWSTDGAGSPMGMEQPQHGPSAAHHSSPVPPSTPTGALHPAVPLALPLLKSRHCAARKEKGKKRSGQGKRGRFSRFQNFVLLGLRRGSPGWEPGQRQSRGQAGSRGGGHPHVTAGAATDFMVRGWELLWPQNKRGRGGRDRQGRSQAAPPMAQAEDGAGATTVPALSPRCPRWSPRGPVPCPLCQAVPPKRFPLLRAGASKQQENQGRRADRRCCQTPKMTSP